MSELKFRGRVLEHIDQAAPEWLVARIGQRPIEQVNEGERQLARAAGPRPLETAEGGSSLTIEQAIELQEKLGPPWMVLNSGTHVEPDDHDRWLQQLPPA